STVGAVGFTWITFGARGVACGSKRISSDLPPLPLSFTSGIFFGAMSIFSVFTGAAVLQPVSQQRSRWKRSRSLARKPTRSHESPHVAGAHAVCAWHLGSRHFGSWHLGSQVHSFGLQHSL